MPKEKKIGKIVKMMKISFSKILEHKWKTIAFLGVILIFIFVSFIADNFFSGRTLVSFLIFLGFVIFMGVISSLLRN